VDIFSFPIYLKIRISTSDILKAFKANGKDKKHLVKYNQVLERVFWGKLWTLKVARKDFNVQIFVLDNNYYFPSCWEASYHSPNLIGKQVFYNRITDDLLSGIPRVGPHVLDHSSFWLIWFQRELKNRRYSTLLSDNIY
jgi:hypothetical protein